MVNIVLVLTVLRICPAPAATFRIVNTDRPGEGLNDTTAALPEGDNDGATVGELRRNAIRRAVQMWADVLDSPVEIVVEVGFAPLGCDADSAVLGQAAPNSVHSEFAGAPDPDTLYVAALANRLAGMDLCPQGSCRNSEDISATFSSSFGTTCEFSGFWYYGLDANPPPGGADLVTVAMHELAHGLGFLSLVRLPSGRLFGGQLDAYTALLEEHGVGAIGALSAAQRVVAFTSGDQLHLVGENTVRAGRELSAGVDESGHVLVYAPSRLEIGSSVSHFDRSLTPNQLMEPVLRFATHDIGVAGGVMQDMGWGVASGECTGDCDGDFQVASAELVLAVRVALGVVPVSECRLADGDGDGQVGIGELIRSVGSALHGCGGTVIESSPGVASVLATQPTGCGGDCDADGRVSVQELVRGVNIALGRADVDTCAALDRNTDGAIGIDELIVAVSRALEGCGCPFDFVDERAGTADACVFTGTWSDQCGDDGLPATFGVANGVVGVAIVTGEGSPALTFFAQPTAAREAVVLGYMFGPEVVQIGGSLTLSADGTELVLRPDSSIDVDIDQCAFDQYRGTFARIVATAGTSSASDASDLVRRALRAASGNAARFAATDSQ